MRLLPSQYAKEHLCRVKNGCAVRDPPVTVRYLFQWRPAFLLSAPTAFSERKTMNDIIRLPFMMFVIVTEW